MRRRASSPATTIRVREAISSARAVAFETAVATSSVNRVSRASVSAGSGVDGVEPTPIIPHSRPSTVIGTPNDETCGCRRWVAAVVPGRSL